MPTGYTAGVQDGSITTLKEYAYTCARAMGALIHMRDESFHAPIPESIEPSSYYKTRLDEVIAEQAELAHMSLDEAEKRANKEYEEKIASEAKYERERNTQRERYKSMLAKVRNWKKSPEGLKGFMISQLEDSIQFDCPETELFTTSYRETVIRLTPEEWLKKAVRTNTRELESASKYYAEELERVAERNAWIKQLHESLANA